MHDKADQPLQAQPLLCIPTYRQSGLGRKPFAPARLVDEECQFDFGNFVNCPGKQPASAQQFSGAPFYRCPESELGVERMTMLMPFKFFLRLGKGASAFREVAPDLGVPVQRKERLEIFRLEVAEC
jgi:hypothetical protein